MISKVFEIDKLDLKKVNFFLFYGENQGHKNEIIEKKFKSRYSNNTFNYDEKEIIDNKENFFNEILTKSFFENEKLILVNRATDKIKDIIEEVIEKEVQDLIIVLNSSILEKKLLLR